MAPESAYWNKFRELYAARRGDELIARDPELADLPAMSRKQFLALLAASAAFAAAGCNSYRDRGEIVPYRKKPEEVSPGVANFYASTCPGCSQACGILIKTREGRPVKVDGNPDHPVNLGKICPAGQGSILALYDPARLTKPKNSQRDGAGGEIPWKKADDEAVRKIREASAAGREIAVITGEIYSPTTAQLLEDFAAAYPGVKVYSFGLFNDEARRKAWSRSYGEPSPRVIDWSRATVIVALESDFLGTEGMTVEQIRLFASGRDIMRSDGFNRLYSIEGAMSLTGANADYRLRLRPDAQMGFVLALLNEVLLVRGAARPEKEIRDAIEGSSLTDFAQKHGLSPDVLRKLTADLLEHRGRAIVHAGGTLPEAVHIAVNYLNEVLGNRALYKNQHGGPLRPLSEPKEIEGLIERMRSGAVAGAIHFGSNPVYHLPASFGYAEALRSVPFSVSLTESEDETAKLCTMALPVSTMFESWGDYSIRTGICSLQQPVIAPLYGTRQKEAVLLSWLKGQSSENETLYHAYLKDRWERQVFPAMKSPADFPSFWYSALHDGVVEYAHAGAGLGNFRAASLSGLSAPISSGGFAVMLTCSHYLGDGAWANNGWLQEIPHPLSKVVWDNYAAVSPATATELSLADGDLIEIRTSAGRAAFPVLLQAGQADRFISVPLGYGRTSAGPVGTGVGVDAGPLMTKESLTGERVFANCTVAKVPGRHLMAFTQERHLPDDEFVKDFHLKRGIIREGTVGEYRKDPGFLQREKPQLFDIAPTVEYKGVKWAMAIDMNKCVGCNACVAGCNVENNIPVVGPDQAGMGRAMHWIRIDRYYSGTPEEPLPSHQPMLCQQCDSAPCENVCPVSATNHSPDGLNQMVYNRCVGTRYCSNNCPYKVRRFNFFNWRDHFAGGYYDQEAVSLVNNPEVTVRSRGVMEKCTFCLQRIMEARQHAAERGRLLAGGDVRTACQEACPATAIVFGDMNDEKSEIARYRSHDTAYHVLEEVNTRPNVTYLAKLKNLREENP